MNLKENDYLLLKLHDLLCKMTDDFNSYFLKHDIKYSLSGGNLIGAIRHNGFIPWDDDMDLLMDRDNYDKFINAWKVDKIDGYTIEFAGSKKTRLNHTKIFKDGTTYCNKKEITKKCHHGIWIDIFTYDKIPTEKKINSKVIRKAKKRVLFTRHAIYKKGNVVELIISLVFYFFPYFIRQRIISRCDKYILKYRNLTENFEYRCLASPGMIKRSYSSEMLSRYEHHKYENYDFMIISDYDNYLTKAYGDYLKLPNENERYCTHKAEIIDLGI